MTIRRETKSFPVAGVKAVDLEAGTFEAIVAVFGNTDLHGDRIAATAFDANLDEWKASGDPIPVIFSHQWHDLSAYLGHADPDDVRALAPGDPELPEAIRDLGGLYLKGQVDTDEPEGRKALKLLKSRTIREFSFAYDVIDEAKDAEGINELKQLNLIEAGPTLKGANPLTQLIGAKAGKALAEAIAAGKDLDASIEAVTKTLRERGSAVAQLAGDAAPKRAAKAFVSLPGSIELLQEDLGRQAGAWASDTYGDNLYSVYIEATYTDSVVLYVELWDDPIDGGRYFSAPYTVAGDTITLGDPEPVEIEASIRPATDPDSDEAKAVARLRARATQLATKAAGAKAGQRHSTADLNRIQGIHDLTADLGALCAEPEGATEEDPEGANTTQPEAAKTTGTGVMLARLDADLQELDL